MKRSQFLGLFALPFLAPLIKKKDADVLDVPGVILSPNNEFAIARLSTGTFAIRLADHILLDGLQKNDIVMDENDNFFLCTDRKDGFALLSPLNDSYFMKGKRFVVCKGSASERTV